MESYHSMNRLRELRGSGYEIVDGQPDIIGWTIKDSANRKIGVVDDLLFDPEEQKVRYIIANLKDNEFDLDRRKVTIPIGIAELHETGDDVFIPSVARWQLRALPTYSQRITDYDERDVYTVFSTGSGATIGEQDKQWQKPQNFYDNASYNHDNLFRKRRQADQKDMPIQRSLRQMPGSMAQEDYSQRAAVENSRLNVGSENESVLMRIRRLQQELGEIERDLQTGRTGR